MKSGRKTKFLLLISFLVLILVTFQFSSCRSKPIQRIEQTKEYMGTFVQIIVYSDKETAGKAIDLAFNRIGEIEKIASHFDEKSEVYRLNEDGHIDNPSEELLDLILKSLQYYELTGRSFDITVQPLLKLWEEGLWKESEEVQKAKVEETLKITGSDKIKAGKNRIEFDLDKMAVTLGGIAKGYGVDEAIKVLKDMGINSALVNAGGDIRVLNPKPPRSPLMWMREFWDTGGNMRLLYHESRGENWYLALENPDDTTQKIAVFEFSNKAIATSGNYERYFDPEKRAHHIIDPETGFSADKSISATVIADTCTEADALATAVFVMGYEEGLKLVESIEGVEALIIDSERNIYKSSGLGDYLKKD